MRILYFAWLREKIGRGEEDFAPPGDVTTPRALIACLRTRGPAYADAFANEDLIRCAVDQEFCGLDAALGTAREIGFFPPVTGG
jgi:molybdopterin synthase sulfur carrier subunit